MLRRGCLRDLDGGVCRSDRARCLGVGRCVDGEIARWMGRGRAGGTERWRGGGGGGGTRWDGGKGGCAERERWERWTIPHI